MGKRTRENNSQVFGASKWVDTKAIREILEGNQVGSGVGIGSFVLDMPVLKWLLEPKPRCQVNYGIYESGAPGRGQDQSSNFESDQHRAGNGEIN